jgi:hypothetical protein
MTLALPAALATLLAAPPAPPAPLAFVACAPGYPGSTSEAQGVMDAFAAALAEAAGFARGGIAAEYHEDEARGLERLSRKDAAFALSPLPFFLKHQAALRLDARVLAVAEGGRVEETWSLVAGKGRVAGPAALEGYEIQSTAGYAPAFVLGVALGAWGGGPRGARVVASPSVLSGLRRAAAGESVALLLAGAEAAALPSLPFAKDLEVVTRSSPVPVIVVAALANRATGAQVEAVTKALLDLHRRPVGAAALAAMRTESFAAQKREPLDRARAAYARAATP